MDAGTAAALRQHRRAQLAERMAAGPAWRDEDWIFCRPDGSHLRPQWLLRRFGELATAAGLPPIKLHEGRHTAATLGLESGVDLKTVSDQLGHAGIAITADLYTHVRRARHDEAAERVAHCCSRTLRTPLARHTSNGRRRRALLARLGLLFDHQRRRRRKTSPTARRTSTRSSARLPRSAMIKTVSW